MNVLVKLYTIKQYLPYQSILIVHQSGSSWRVTQSPKIKTWNNIYRLLRCYGSVTSPTFSDLDKKNLSKSLQPSSRLYIASREIFIALEPMRVYTVQSLNGPNNEGLIPIRLLSYRFGLAGLEYLNHKCVCFLPLSQS